MFDLANAFVKADNDEFVLMVLRGRMAELMVRVNPDLCREYIQYSNKGVPMLYVQLSKALYGMLRAALLFYKKLRGDLEDLDSIVNPYDPCVANKMINGKQITVCWHVDDLKVSHEDETVLDWFEEKLVELYGKKTTVHLSLIHI